MSAHIKIDLRGRTQAEALLDFFKEYVVNAEPDDVAESLLRDIMIKVFKKIRTKCENYDRHGWSLQLSKEEAKAYYIYWQNRAISHTYILEKTMIQSHVAQIDRVHG